MYSGVLSLINNFQIGEESVFDCIFRRQEVQWTECLYVQSYITTQLQLIEENTFLYLVLASSTYQCFCYFHSFII